MFFRNFAREYGSLNQPSLKYGSHIFMIKESKHYYEEDELIVIVPASKQLNKNINFVTIHSEILVPNKVRQRLTN